MTNFKTKLLAGAAVLAMTATGAAYANQVNSTQSGADNLIEVMQWGEGAGQTANSNVNGELNEVTILQGNEDAPSGSANQSGNTANVVVAPAGSGAVSEENLLKINQNKDASGGSGGNNTSSIYVEGDRNDVTTSVGGARGATSVVNLTGDNEADDNVIVVQQGNGANSSIVAEGDDNEVNVTQSQNVVARVFIGGTSDLENGHAEGDDNVINIDQVRRIGAGSNPQVNVAIYGDDNNIDADQNNSIGDTMNINIGSSSIDADSNRVKASQGGSITANLMNINVFGSNNLVDATQRAGNNGNTGNEANILQDGTGNIARSDQAGSNGLLNSQQFGTGNFFRVVQRQRSVDATTNIFQSGADNTALVDQNGIGAVANVTQLNADNFANIIQRGDSGNIANVQQDGTGNDALIMQNANAFVLGR